MKTQDPNVFTTRFLIVCIACIGLCLAAGPLNAQEDDDDTTTSASSDWLTFSANPEHTGKTTNIGPPEEMEMKWRWRVNYDTEPISASPVVDSDGTLYIGTQGGYMAAVKPEGGRGWIYNIDGSVKKAASVESDGSVFVVTEDGYAYYLDSSGELQWKSDFNIDVDTAPVLSNGTAYIGTDDKTLLAVDLTPDISGIEPDSKKLLKSDVIDWSFNAAGTVKSSPTFAGNTVYFGGGNYLYAVNPNAADSDNSSSMVKWRYHINADIHSSPAVYNGVVYVGADDGYLYAFNENVGNSDDVEYIWKRKTGGAVKTSPAVDDPEDGDVMIYVGSDDGHLYAIDENGELQWTYSTFGAVRSSPAVDGNGDVYFGSDDGNVYALYPDGSLKWRYSFEDLSLGQPVRSSPAIGPDEKLYIGTQGGYVYCIGEATEENKEPDLSIDVSLSLTSIENDGNPTIISATITSDAEGENVLSRIASVTLDLSTLGLQAFDNATGSFVEVGKETMLDDGLFDDDSLGDGIFTYVFGITDVLSLVGFDQGVNTLYAVAGTLGVGPVPLIVTVTDLYGNRVSKPVALNIQQKDVGTPVSAGNTPSPITIINNLEKQTLNIAFSSGTPSILSVTPGIGAPGQRVTVIITGKNTNFIKDKTRVEIFNGVDAAPIAGAYPENDDVVVNSDTSLTAVLNIISEDKAISGDLIGRWDVTVTTEFASGAVETVVGVTMFEIAVVSSSIHAPVPVRQQKIETLQDSCEFSLDITNAGGARPDGAPWRINVGYDRDITIEDAGQGNWLVYVTKNDECTTDLNFKIVTSGSNFGYLVGEVRNGFTGQGVDNATVSAGIGELIDIPINSTRTSGGGYFMLPLSAAEDSYTITAQKGGLIDIEREVKITADAETEFNFSLMTDFRCPVSGLVSGDNRRVFYALRDGEFAKRARGMQWIALYYTHAAELSSMLQENPGLKRLCRRFLTNTGLVLSGHPLLMQTKNSMLDDLAEIIETVAGLAGPDLSSDLQSEYPHMRAFIENFKKGQ